MNKLLLLLRNSAFKKFFLAVCFLFITSSALAAHFRAGFISWRVDNNDPSGRTIIFKVSQSYGGWALNSVNNSQVGQDVGRWDRLNFGDGNSANVNLVMTAYNPAEGYWFGEAIITHKYASARNFTSSFGSCCRISSLSNNANTSWYNSSVVNVGSGNNSPVATLPAVINVQQGFSAATFQLPASDPDGDVLTYRVANPGEAGSGNSNPPGLSINSSTGVVSYNTKSKNIGALYSAAFVVSDGNTSVLMDVILKIVQQSNAPDFDYTYTPSNGSVYQVAPGQNVNFNIRGYDNDANSTVTLQGIGIPQGAIVNPAMPFSGPSGSNTVPVIANFSWTPQNNALGTNVISFIAQDQFGVQTSTSVTIQVSLAPVFDVPPTPVSGAHNIVVSPGTLIQYTVQSSDPDPTDVVQIVAVEGKDMMGNKISIYTGASLSSLPTTASNPTSGVFSWTPTQAQWGHKHVYFTAEDSYGDQTLHEVSQLVNTPPAFTSSPLLTGDVGVLYSYTIQVIDPDLTYGDELTIFGNPIPAWLTITDNGNGTATLSGTPTVTDVGNASINIQAEDKHHHEDPRGTINQVFDITVNNCQVNAITKDITIELNASGNATINTSQIDNGSTASCRKL